MLQDTSELKQHIAEVLYRQAGESSQASNPDRNEFPSSSVLVPLWRSPEDGIPHLILNKRSAQVRQPGDLCFPGGGSELPLDRLIAESLRLPGSPLTRWPFWHTYQHRSRREIDDLALVLATGLRESLEEMSLFSHSVLFLGPLPAQRLVMFDRQIQPMVVWLESEQRFKTNWEVERVITLPVRNLLDHRNYRTFHISYAPKVAARLGIPSQDFPAFCLTDGPVDEMLWGVTFRIVQTFLKLVFSYDMPPLHTLPAVNGTLGMEYYTGRMNDS